jgi:hypothetical protein
MAKKKMTKEEFLQKIQKRVAECSIGPTTLWGQGKGVTAEARKYLTTMLLDSFSVTEEKVFLEQLEDHTNKLKDSFPKCAENNWGAARKSLNIFLRDALYNRYLCDHFKLMPIEAWLEVPLDKGVGNGLYKDDPKKSLDKWKSIKGLKPEISQKFQEVAQSVADELSIARVHLDLKYWRRTQQNKKEVSK